MSNTEKMCDCNQGRLPCTCKPAEQPQGEPVAWRTGSVIWSYEADARRHAEPSKMAVEPLHTHADSGEVERLRKPAKVGGVRFGVGCKISLVVEAAIRQYEYDVTPEKEAARIKRVELLQQLVRPGREIEILRARLAESHALLGRSLGAIAEVGRQDHLIDYIKVDVVKSEIEKFLPSCVEPAKVWRYRFDEAKGSMVADPAGDWSYLGDTSNSACETCSGEGIVGNILNAETCTACTPSAQCDGGTCGLGGFCDNCPKVKGPSATVEGDERAEFEIASVLGFPSYSVSSDGIVYRNGSGNAISQQANSKGYLTVNLSEAGKATRRTVHRVVLESFVGVRPEGFQALHGDGNPANNRLSNLRWGAPSENEADKALHGTKAIGSRNGASRLTEAMVQEILEAKRVGGKKWGAGRLAKKFGVDISTVTRAARGKHWSEARAALEFKPK